MAKNFQTCFYPIFSFAIESYIYETDFTHDISQTYHVWVNFPENVRYLGQMPDLFNNSDIFPNRDYSNKSDIIPIRKNVFINLFPDPNSHCCVPLIVNLTTSLINCLVASSWI